MNKTLFGFICLIICAMTIQAQDISLDDIVAKKYAAKSVAVSNMMKDGSSYVAISEDGLSLLRYELKSGQLLDTIVNVEKTREHQMKHI